MNTLGQTFDKIIHMSRLHEISRRLTALALATVMTAGLLPAAHAAGVWPLQAVINVEDPTVDPGVPDGSGEAPTITIEANGVIDQGRKLTGFLEVAIRVKPGVLHLDAAGNVLTSKNDPAYDHSETQPFSSLAVALEYSDKLTPWEWEKVDGDWNRLDETDAANQTTAVDATAAVGGGFSARKMVEIDPLHKSTRIAHAAISPKGTVTDGGTGDDGSALPPTVTLTGGGYLYLMAEGFTAKDFNGEDTVLAVVRFKYELDEADENNNPWGTMFSKGLNNPAVTEWIDPASPNCLVKLADAAAVRDPLDPIVDWEVTYDSGKSATRPQGNGFYYSTDTSDGREAYDPTKPTTDPDFASTTSNCMEVAPVDAAPSTTTVLPGKINYTLVNKLSYNFASGDSAVILYYDWDDRHIGTQVLSPGDAREAVNEYVEENFIHPDLRYSGHKTDADAVNYTDSLLRENTYRGEYPYDAPVAIPDVSSPTYEADLAAYQAQIAGTVAADGADYPLTNKLDYVFFKRYTEMGQTVTDPDGVPDSGDETSTPARTLVDPDGVADSGDEYYHIDSYDARLLGGLTAADVEEPGLLELPYIYGWAVVNDLDGITDVWTTLGTAEHTPYSGMDDANGNAPKDTTVDTAYGVTGQCLQFADFSNLQKGQVVRVKAVYEPGTELKYNFLYNATSLPTYERYGEANTDAGGVYAISFKYERIDLDGRGVSRLRDPAVRIDYTPDVEGEGQKPFSIGLDVANTDVMSVTYTPSSALMSMEYSVRDRLIYDGSRFAEPTMIEYNFYTGSERSSHGNLNNIMQNFNYTEHPYSEHLGSMGFVTVSTLNQIAKLSREAAATGSMVDMNAYISIGTISDMNWKADLSEKEFESWEMPMVLAKLVDAYRIAGNAPLDWHQVQYHLITSSYDWGTEAVTGGLTNNGGVISPAASALAYNWCRIDDCSGGSAPINSWEDLMKAAADYVYTPNTNALNQLQDVFHLRQGITAQPFADKDAMKTKLVAVATDLKTNGFTKAQVEALSWRQVQYLMDVGTTGITPANLPVNSDIAPTGSTKKDYWWENGGAKTISTWQELLEIQYHIINDNWFAGDNDNSGWRSGYTSPTTPLTGSVRDKDSDGNWKPTTDPNPFTTKSVSLRKDAAGAAFANITQFDTALSTAISTLTGEAAYQGGSFANVSLMEIQHAMLGNPYRTESDLMDDTVAGTVNYWWITGASTPKNLKELVTLVKQVVDGAPEDLLDNVTVELVSKAPFWLRADDAGTTFSSDSDLHDALLYAVEEWCNAGNDPATAPWPDTTNTNWSNAATRQVWSQLQNLLLGNPYNGDPDPGPTYAFWWYGDGHKPITNLKELLEAAWNTWGGPGGGAPSDSTDPNAMDALDETAANLKFITGVLKTDGAYAATDLYFRKNDDGDAFDSVTDFKTQMKNAVQIIKGVVNNKQFFKDRTWEELQYVLINGGYKSDGDIAADDSINYWWKDGEPKPTGPAVNYTWANNTINELTIFASDYALNVNGDGTISGADIEGQMTDTMVRALNICDSSGNPLNRSQLANKIAQAITDFYTEIFDSGATGTDWDDLMDDNSNLVLNWASLQKWILTGDRENASPSDLPPTCTWTPKNDITEAVDYTQADAWVSALVYIASDYALNLNGDGTVSSGDLIGSISNVEKDLDLRDSGGTRLTDSGIASAIADAVTNFYTDIFNSDDGTTGTDWDNFMDDDSYITMGWATLQQYLLDGQRVDLSGKNYEALAALGIDWYPPNDPVVPGTFSLRNPIKVQALKAVQESETTDVVTSEDGSRSVTTVIRTKVDPNTGLTTVEETRTEERRYSDGSVETVTDITITVKDTATGEVVSRETRLGTPVVTDGAEVVEPTEPEKPVDPEEKPTDPEEKPTDPEEKPTDPEEKPTDPEEKPTDPEEKPTEPEEKPTEPEEKPTEPEEKPTEPEEKPTEPEEKPTDPEETPTEPEEIGSTDPPFARSKGRTRAKTLRLKLGLPTAWPRYAGPPNGQRYLRPPIFGLIHHSNDHILTTGRTLL